MSPRPWHCALAMAAALAVLVAETKAQPPAREAPPTSSEPPVLGLAELLAAAEANYPSLRAAGYAIEAAEERLDEARVSPFFQFNVEGGVAMVPDAQGTPIFTNNGQLGNLGSWGPATSASIAGAIPLYTFGKLRNTWRAARAGVRAAELGEERSLAQVRLDVRRAFYGLQLALDVQQMIGEGLGKLERAVQTLDERIEEGDADVDPMDRYRLGSALAEVQARRSQALLLEGTARAALRTLTGLETFEISDCPIAQLAIEPEDAERYVAGLDRRPEVGQLAQAVEARRAEAAIHRARFYPDLVLAMSANASYAPNVTNVRNPFIQDRANTIGFGVGIGLRWSLDVAGNVHRVRRAQAQVGELEAQAEEARRGMSLEVRLARERLDDAARRASAWIEGERQGRQWFVAAVQAYQVGTVEAKTLVDSLRAYFQARFSRLEAVHDYNVAAATLERVSGRTLLPAEAWDPRCGE